MQKFGLAAAVLGAALLISPQLAHATERWSCWMPLGKTAVGTDYLIDGRIMRRDTSGSHYGDGWNWQVLRNDKYSVMAQWAPVNRGNGDVYLSVWTILINKVSGTFVSAQISDTARGIIQHGGCYRDHPPKGKFWQNFKPVN